MTRELREMRVRLAEAERAAAFQDIARRIAHEIKNPLSPIQLAMETLRKAHAKQDRRLRRDLRGVHARGARRGAPHGAHRARVQRVRAPAQAATGSAGARQRWSRKSRSSIARRTWRWTIEKDASLPDVRVDREQITQVLVNLLQNAFDAARTAGAAAPRVRVSVRAEARKRRARGGRQRSGGARERARAHLRALRHHQGPGHRPRSGDREAHRERPPGRRIA